MQKKQNKETGQRIRNMINDKEKSVSIDTLHIHAEDGT